MRHKSVFYRWVCLAMLLVLLLTACTGASPVPTTQPTIIPTETTPATTQPTTAPTTLPTAEPTTEPPTVPTAPPSVPEQILRDMTLEEKVWQLFVLAADQLTGVGGTNMAGDTTKAALQDKPIGGLIYFSENLLNADQISAMISGTQSFSKIPLLICVDEEGGPVSRLSGIGVTDAFEPMAVYGAAGDGEAVRQIGATLGRQMGAVGFNVNFAPVADVVTNPNNYEIGNRSFNSDPQIAALMVSAMVDGLQEQNVIACLKHFPGHGSTEANSHNGLSLTSRTLDQLRSTELIPFRSGIAAGANMVMISHMSAPNITGSDIPCDLSETVVTDLLRNELLFTGVVVTDAHNMGAITEFYSSGEAAVLAIRAGCDIVLMPAEPQAAFDAVMAAVANGDLAESRIDESVLRILKLKAQFGILEMLNNS